LDSKPARLIGWGHGDGAACCSSTGVACDLGRVVTLYLSNKSLHDGISSALASLDALAALNLSRNALRGAAPEELARLWSLRVLDLSANAPRVADARVVAQRSIATTMPKIQEP